MEVGPEKWMFPDNSSSAAVLQSTPQDARMLEASLRDPASSWMTPFGADFEDTERDEIRNSNNKDWHEIASGGVHARWLALIELQHENFAYNNTMSTRLPVTHPLLRQAIHASRQRRRADPDRIRIKSSQDLVGVLLSVISTDIRKMWLVQFCGDKRYRSKQAFAEVDPHDNTRWWVTLKRRFVERIADMFFEFVTRFNLHGELQSVDSLQLAVMAIFHARLLIKPKKKVKMKSDASFAYPLPLYVPASSVRSPSVPHFIEVSQLTSNDPKQTRMQAPRVCQLCGVGCLDWPSLFKHCDKCHHSYVEARKRAIFCAEEELDALPLRPQRKRTMLANFSFRQTCSVPGKGCLGQGQAAMRQRVACPVCAVEDWIDFFFPCYMWKPCPFEEDDEEDASDSDDDLHNKEREEAIPGRKKQRRLQDDQGFLYFGDAASVDRLLNVEAYVKAWPLIPKAELYASSVRHPAQKEYRWLLNSRRVPTTPETDDDVRGSASEHVTAGFGEQDKAVWLCGTCADCLCVKHPVMPPFALANWLWLGREHPAFQNLTLATKQLLGRARAVLRLLVLKHKAEEDEEEKGLVGNSILLTQSDLGEALECLPPEETKIAEWLPIIFATSQEDVSKRKPLYVPRSQYLKCATIRKQVCSAFQDVNIDEAKAASAFQEDGVPHVLIRNAVHIAAVEYFEPSLLGPASRRDAASLPQELPEDVSDHETEINASESSPHSASEHSSQTNPLTALLPENCMVAEHLIGINEADGVDTVQQFVVFQEKLKIVEEEAKRLLQTEIEKRRTDDNVSSDHQMEHAMGQAAAEVRHAKAVLDLQAIVQKMGPEYQRRLESTVTAAQTRHGSALKVVAKKAVDTFDPVAWPLAFVEFFYGDGVPNLSRPVTLSWRLLFQHLQRREELEYHLPTDKDDEDIGRSASEHRRYKAKSKSRFDTPEFAAMFADNLRRMNILQTTKGFFAKVGKKFAPELNKIAKLKSSEIEQLQGSVKSAPNQSLSSWLAISKAKGQPNVQVALSHLLMNTANVPLTEGYKMSLRHTGHAMNLKEGPLSLFFTVNLADTYSPLSLTLLHGAGEPLGATTSKGNVKELGRRVKPGCG